MFFRCIAIALTLLTIDCMAWRLPESPRRRVEIEKEIGNDFAVRAAQTFQFVEEDEVVEFVRTMGTHIVQTVGRSPYSYRFSIVVEPSINAFAVPGGYVYIHTGLIAEVSSPDELAGVLAHEIGHVEANHFLRRYEKSGQTNIASIAASALALIFLPPKEGIAVATAAQATNIAKQLQYTREMESEADLLALKYLSKAHYDPEGLTQFLEKLKSPVEIPRYLLTHPLSQERIGAIYQNLPNFPYEPHRETDLLAFHKIQAIVRAQSQPITQVLPAYEKRAKNAEGHFLLGIVQKWTGSPLDAQRSFEKAISLDPKPPEFYLELASVLSTLGSEKAAQERIKQAQEIAPENPAVLNIVTQIHEQREEWDQAIPLLTKLLSLRAYSSQIHYRLGIAYGRNGDPAAGHFHLGESYLIQWDFVRARQHFSKASELYGKETELGQKALKKLKEIDALES
ncbi:MAG: M48 family metalloprotease [Deltaproteobacteria bacterium]|nr:M48 family metalloprotease [Deltaproteobacteria bacterium]